MYRAIGLANPDKDLHRFVWRENTDDILSDYRTTRVTFGVSASSFAANMSIKQNAIELAGSYPLAHKAVRHSFYVDDGLIGAKSFEQAVKLQRELQEAFSLGGFLLQKWNSSEPDVLRHLSDDLKATQSSCTIPDPDQYTKTLGIEWNSKADHFRLTIADPPFKGNITKRALVSDIAKNFDVFGWFAPVTIVVKILLQCVWEEKVDWNVPARIQSVWLRWRIELKMLSSKHIPRCHFPKDCYIISTEVHGFSDSSGDAYAAVVYLRMIDTKGDVHVSIVMSKTNVAAIKRLTIPRLELCGAHLLSQLLSHIKSLYLIPLNIIFAWTDSTLVLDWLVGNPRRFKVFVGNCVSNIVDSIPADNWKHFRGDDNPADCASRELFPSELLQHEWWKGPKWLSLGREHWPNEPRLFIITVRQIMEMRK